MLDWIKFFHSVVEALFGKVRDLYPLGLQLELMYWVTIKEIDTINVVVKRNY